MCCLGQDSKIQRVVSFLKIPTSLSLSKAVQLLGQLQTITDVNKGDFNGKKKKNFWSDAIFVFRKEDFTLKIHLQQVINFLKFIIERFLLEINQMIGRKDPSTELVKILGQESSQSLLTSHFSLLTSHPLFVSRLHQ